MLFLKLLPTLLIKLTFNILYFIFKLLFKLDNNKITFASYRYEKLEGNLKYTYEALKNYPNDFNYNFLFKKLNTSIRGKFGYALHMVKSCYYLAVSRYFIIDDFYFPVYLINPRVGVEIVQLWHGAGAFKKFGYSLLGTKYGVSETYLKHIKIHSNYSIVIVSSNNVIEFFAEAFNTNASKIFPIGLPRTDLFFDEEKKSNIKIQFIESFPHLQNKKIILYAPTFRGSGHYQGEYKLPINLRVLMRQLDESFILIIHLHPYINENLIIPEEYTHRVITKTAPYTINELMVISDMLVTDYSSVIFEYSLLIKPIIFYSYDLEEYLAERNFYLEYESSVPGPIVYNTQELVNILTRENYDLEKIKAFRNKYFNYLDGKASNRVAELLIKRSNQAENTFLARDH